MIIDPRGFGQAENPIFESRSVYIPKNDKVATKYNPFFYHFATRNLYQLNSWCLKLKPNSKFTTPTDSCLTQKKSATSPS